MSVSAGVNQLWRHEVVNAGIPPHPDVDEQSGKDARLDRLDLVRQVAVSQKHRETGVRKPASVKSVRLEGGDQGGDARRSLLHLWRNRRRWRRNLDAWLDLLTDERRHELGSLQTAQLCLQYSKQLLFEVRAPSWYGGGLEKREGEQALRPGARISQRDESAGGIPDQVEAVQVLRIGESIDRLQLVFDCVVAARRRLAVHLKVLQVKVSRVANRIDQRRVSLRRWGNAARNADDLRFHTGARRRMTSRASSTFLGSSPTTRITSSLVSKFG